NKYRDEVRSRVPRHVVAALAERTVFLWSKVRYSGKLVNSWCPTDSGKTRTTRTVARATVAENGRRTEWSQDHPCLGDLVPLPFCRIRRSPRGSGPYLLGPVVPLITASMNVRPKSTPAIGCASSSLFSRWRRAQSRSNATKTSNAFHPCPRS